MKLYDKIQKLAYEQDMTIKDLEKRANIANGNIRRWNSSYPSIDKAKRVADILGVDLNFLVNEETDISELTKEQNMEIQKLKEKYQKEQIQNQLIIKKLIEAFSRENQKGPIFVKKNDTITEALKSLNSNSSDLYHKEAAYLIINKANQTIDEREEFYTEILKKIYKNRSIEEIYESDSFPEFLDQICEMTYRIIEDSIGKENKELCFKKLSQKNLDLIHLNITNYLTKLV